MVTDWDWYLKFIYLRKLEKETTMATKFIGFIPADGTPGVYPYTAPKTEQFTNVDSLKEWAGRQIMADAKIKTVFGYRLDKEFRTKNLIGDHIDVIDRA